MYSIYVLKDVMQVVFQNCVIPFSGIKFGRLAALCGCFGTKAFCCTFCVLFRVFWFYCIASQGY